MPNDLTKSQPGIRLTLTGPRRIYSGMNNVKALPGIWRLHIITSENTEASSGSDLNNTELFVFREDGTFDKHLKIEGKIQTTIKNQKWVKGPRDIFMTNNNRPYYEIDLLTHDTLVLKTKGTDVKRVYKKVK